MDLLKQKISEDLFQPHYGHSHQADDVFSAGDKYLNDITVKEEIFHAEEKLLQYDVPHEAVSLSNHNNIVKHSMEPLKEEVEQNWFETCYVKQEFPAEFSVEETNNYIERKYLSSVVAKEEPPSFEVGFNNVQNYTKLEEIAGDVHQQNGVKQETTESVDASILRKGEDNPSVTDPLNEVYNLSNSNSDTDSIQLSQNNMLHERRHDSNTSTGKFCGTCGKVGKYNKDTHTYIHKCKCQYKCNICVRKFKSQWHLNIHMMGNNHEGSSYVCDTCGKVFKSSHAVRNHLLKVHVKVKKYECDVCGKRFNYKYYMSQHLANHKSVVVICEVCGKYVKKKSFFMHLKNHNTQIKVKCKCDICGKNFKGRMHIYAHMLSCHSERKINYICNICNKTFRSRACVSVHMKIHTRGRDYNCDKCGKDFLHKASYKRHLSVHVRMQKYTCSYCNKAFDLKHFFNHFCIGRTFTSGECATEVNCLSEDASSTLKLKNEFIEFKSNGEKCSNNVNFFSESVYLKQKSEYNVTDFKNDGGICFDFNNLNYSEAVLFHQNPVNNVLNFTANNETCVFQFQQSPFLFSINAYKNGS